MYFFSLLSNFFEKFPSSCNIIFKTLSIFQLSPSKPCSPSNTHRSSSKHSSYSLFYSGFSSNSCLSYIPPSFSKSSVIFYMNYASSNYYFFCSPFSMMMILQLRFPSHTRYWPADLYKFEQGVKETEWSLKTIFLMGFEFYLQFDTFFIWMGQSKFIDLIVWVFSWGTLFRCQF